MLAVALALPALRADEKPKDDAKSPKEQYAALLKEYSDQQQKMIGAVQKASGAEQQKLLQTYRGLGKEFAEKFYKLAEDNPKDPAAADALIWVMQNGNGSDVYEKAVDKVTTLAAEMPLADLARRLAAVRAGNRKFVEAVFERAEKNEKDPAATDLLFWVVQSGRGSSVYEKASEKVAMLVAEMPLKDLARKLNATAGDSPALMDAVLKRAEKEEKDPLAGDLLGWIAANGMYQPAGRTAAERLLQNFPDHPAVERVCMMLPSMRNPRAPELLKHVFEKTTKPGIKAAAALGIGKALAAKVDSLGDEPAEADKAAAEAGKYFVMIDTLAKDNAQMKQEAARELKTLRTVRVGKAAPEITAGDLDEKEFKLSDYRGKVVLLDFWGNW